MLQSTLKSRVGQRLLLRFLLAALVPMGGMAWYAYDHVSDLLLDMTHQRLRQNSKAFAMSVVEELVWRSNELKRLAGQIPGLTELSIHTPDGFGKVSSEPRPDLGEKERQHFDRGNVVLRQVGNRIEMIAPIPGSDRALIGVTEDSSPWRNDSAPESYCVLDTAYAPLYCTAGLLPPDGQALPGLLGDRHSGVFPWRVGGSEHLVGYWHASYLPALASPGFVVLVATQRDAALKDLDRFRRLFPAIVILALGLAAGLAIGQIKRQMKPLGLLADGTRRLASGNLGARVELAGDDEFADLGQAFNSMATSLEYKFHMLRMLAELDKAILSANEMDHVVQKVLSHIRQAIPCDGAGLLRLDRHGGSTLLTRRPGDDGQAMVSRVSVGDTGLADQVSDRAWHRIELGQEQPDYLRRLCERPLAQLIAFPVRIDGRLEGLLLLAYMSTPEDIEEIAQAGRSLADRLAIATSSFAWEEKLYHQAHYDALTDLPNRVLLRDRVEQAIMRAARNQTSIGLMLIDLDNFKQVNDSLGHSAGDQLLVEYARRLQQRTRQGDTVARLGGDEFIVLVADLARGEEYAALDNLARGLNGTLAQPFMLGEQQLISPVSIGIAVYPENATEFEDLLKMADAAMYESKRQQPGSFRFYSSDINLQTRARFELTQELREAVARQELLMYYQPKIDAATGRIAGAEALVRWNSPRRGLVPPVVFVRLLDEMGLGLWLGEWVLDTVCAQMREWDRRGLPAIPVSINLSPTQFERTPILDKVEAALDKYRLAPDRLELEILEATAVSDSAEVRENLVRLRARGVNIALDDFGTGYSSLVYLTQVPANVLKLDRAFIRTLASDHRQREIVKLIISLAKVLNFTVVAEGVEEEAQLGLLADMGCDHIQGYLISRPIPAAEFAEHWLR